MKLSEIHDLPCKPAHAFNEVVGQLVSFDRTGRPWLLLEGDVTQSTLCSLLFDEETIAQSWAPMSSEEAVERVRMAVAKADGDGVFLVRDTVPEDIDDAQGDAVEMLLELFD